MKRIIVLLQKNIKLIIVLLAVTAAAVILTLAFVSRHDKSSQSDLSRVLENVGRLMILPTNEKPTLATVTDTHQIKDKFLSAKTKNGDRVLIYAKNQIVIIYRPSIDKIAGVGTVNGDPAFVQAQGATITVLDSTNNQPKTDKIISQLHEAYPDIKVKNGGKTNRQDFPYTIVIDNTDEKSELRGSLMKIISGKQGIQPSSEDVALTDFLIIVGLDK